MQVKTTHTAPTCQAVGAGACWAKAGLPGPARDPARDTDPVPVILILVRILILILTLLPIL